MVDRAVAAAKIAAVRDAVARVREMLPVSPEAFADDRTTREVVTLNIFVATQACLDLAAHRLADGGWEMPGAYSDVFMALAQHNVIGSSLATRLAGAAAFRNLVARQYGVLDWRRVHAHSCLGAGRSRGILPGDRRPRRRRCLTDVGCRAFMSGACAQAL